MAKPGFVEARPKGGGEIQLVPEHWVTNEGIGFKPVASIRDTGKKATSQQSNEQEESK